MKSLMEIIKVYMNILLTLILNGDPSHGPFYKLQIDFLPLDSLLQLCLTYQGWESNAKCERYWGKESLRINM